MQGMEYQKKSKKKVVPSVSKNDEKKLIVSRPTILFQLLDNINISGSVFIILLSLSLYANTIWNDYALDDKAVIQANRFTQQGIAGIPTLLRTFYWEGFWNDNAGLYRPLSMITFAIEWQISPDNPHLNHATNVVLYAISGLLLFVVLSLLLSKYHKLLPFLITALYIAHPIHTEVVANIKSRDEILCFLLFLSTVYFLIRYINTQSLRPFIFSVVSYFLCLLSKESAATFLFIFPAILFYFTEIPLKQYLKVLYPHILVLIGYFFLRFIILDSITTLKSYTYLDNSLMAAPTIGVRLATAIYILGKYIWLLIFPYPLSYDYSFLEIPFRKWTDYQTFLPLILYLGAGVYTIQRIFTGKKDLISFGILFFLITLSIVSNIFFLIGATMAERFLYIPSLGFCMIVAVLMLNLFRIPVLVQPGKKEQLSTLPGKMLIGLLLIILTVFSYLVINRNKDWETTQTLFEKDVVAAPGSSRTHYNFGTVALGRYDRNNEDTATNNKTLAIALWELSKSASIDPSHPLTLMNLANAYYMHGDYNLAIENAKECLKFNPDETKAYSVLGNAYYRVKDYPRAIENLQKSIQLKYYTAETYNFLGGAYVGISDLNNAISAYQKAIALDKTNVELITNLASVYGMSKDYQHAIQYFKRAIVLKPGNAQLYYITSTTFLNLGKKDSAAYYFNLGTKIQTRQ
jgi:tetratricopeptide (TPR) repeat protein